MFPLPLQCFSRHVFTLEMTKYVFSGRFSNPKCDSHKSHCRVQLCRFLIVFMRMWICLIEAEASVMFWCRSGIYIFRFLLENRSRTNRDTTSNPEAFPQLQEWECIVLCWSTSNNFIYSIIDEEETRLAYAITSTIALRPPNSWIHVTEKTYLFMDLSKVKATSTSLPFKQNLIIHKLKKTFLYKNICNISLCLSTNVRTRPWQEWSQLCLLF